MKGNQAKIPELLSSEQEVEKSCLIRWW